MHILVTGSEGFIARNLIAHLQELDNAHIYELNKSKTINDISYLLKDIDWIFHIAGVNRPKNENEMKSGNQNLTSDLCKAIKISKRKI